MDFHVSAPHHTANRPPPNCYSDPLRFQERYLPSRILHSRAAAVRAIPAAAIDFEEQFSAGQLEWVLSLDTEEVRGWRLARTVRFWFLAFDLVECFAIWTWLFSLPLRLVQHKRLTLPYLSVGDCCEYAQAGRREAGGGEEGG